MELKEINFAVSNACNADCLYCPRSLVEAKRKFMSVSLVEHIMQEITSEPFKREHSVTQSVCSENGEPFLNPRILDILRTVKAYGIPVLLFSNFALIDEKMALAVISEGLTHAIHFNIDGSTPESYRASKGLDLETVRANIQRFIEIRRECKADIRLFGHIITEHGYSNAVLRFFGRLPVKLKDKPIHPDDRIETLLTWQSILDPALDNIGIDSVMFWAERYGTPAVRDYYRCPNLDRIKHCAYINPEGNWYNCCFDMGNDLIIGNVLESRLSELAKSERRKQLITDLENQDFEKVGWPCSRVDACQGMAV